MDDLDPGMRILTTLGEAGGITGLVTTVIGLLIYLVKKNGCTSRCYNCSGQPVMVVDCEDGAPGRRYRPKPAGGSESSAPASSVPPTESAIEAIEGGRGLD